jgi:Na+-driven multidrug efflux pump
MARHVGAASAEPATRQGALLARDRAVRHRGGMLAVGPLYASLGMEPAVARQAVGYLRILLGGAVISTLYVWAESTMRAAGDTRTPLVVTASSIALNAALDPLLIFGLGPFPRLGVAGAAVATVIAQTSR